MPNCNCDMRTKLVGDGCEICNPIRAVEYYKEEVERLRKVEKAAQWYVDNADSPKSALTYIRRALEA